MTFFEDTFDLVDDLARIEALTAVAIRAGGPTGFTRLPGGVWFSAMRCEKTDISYSAIVSFAYGPMLVKSAHSA